MNVGPGILTAIKNNGDFPVKNSDFEGNYYEHNQTLKGDYYASNSGPNGQWEIVFVPFVGAVQLV